MVHTWNYRSELVGVWSLISPWVFGGLDSDCRPGSTLLSSFVISLLSMLISSVQRRLSLELVDSKSQTKAGVKSAENAFRRNHMLLCCSCTKTQQDHRKFTVKSINLRARWEGAK